MSGHRFHVNKADRLLQPARYELLQPEKRIEEFGIQKEDVIADLGAGNGFFTLPMAARSQKVYAVDIEPKMLQLLKQRADEQQLRNIELVESSLDNIRLEDHSIDKALAAFVLHEVPHLDKTFAEIKRILKPNGTLYIIEWEAVQSEMGPPLHERIGSNTLAQVVKSHGFTVEALHLHSSFYVLIAK
ncbi:class I SAM-dependent methyltransferase [Anoxybacillus sp. J5B_2022]|uniref:class I SAM-dependent methyltransferase n=1 Tax=Anoxybacillus sp. J5B_2022 TaxID=3003246 RepID=UPI0022867F8D|nr:class I SAM-dependent methyltransferase [Anoxybacillus sp. J5B_2022]MCZ0755071.1 class I SAM-dependent methyltransferase [Anoxybacillus sp. J5B_2022]